MAPKSSKSQIVNIFGSYVSAECSLDPMRVYLVLPVPIPTNESVSQKQATSRRTPCSRGRLQQGWVQTNAMESIFVGVKVSLGKHFSSRCFRHSTLDTPTLDKLRPRQQRDNRIP